MNTSHLDTLLAIVDSGSFEAAADDLGISPSAVSQRIKALESQAGRILLRRTTPVQVTEAGSVVIQAARRIALIQHEMDTSLRQRMSRVPLTIAVNADSLASWFLPVIDDTAQRGDVALRISIEDEARTLRLLRRGDVLGAITREETPVSGCESSPLGTFRYLAVAQPELARHYQSEGKTDWYRMPVINFGPNDHILNEAMRMRMPQGKVSGRLMSQVTTTDGYLYAVKAGLGWGIVAELLAQPFLDSGQLVCLDSEPIDVALYWQRWRVESEELEALTDSVLDAAQALR